MDTRDISWGDPRKAALSRCWIAERRIRLACVFADSLGCLIGWPLPCPAQSTAAARTQDATADIIASLRSRNFDEALQRSDAAIKKAPATIAFGRCVAWLSPAKVRLKLRSQRINTLSSFLPLIFLRWKEQRRSNIRKGATTRNRFCYACLRSRRATPRLTPCWPRSTTRHNSGGSSASLSASGSLLEISLPC